MSEPPFREPLLIGDRVLDRYEVVERLEKGGHSIVYRGYDERLCRPVCIKVFHKLAERHEVWLATYEHFVQEAFALSKLSHPNTLRIYDFGHLDLEEGSDSAPFQVSEFMDGGTLSELVRERGRLDRRDASRIVVALSGALAEAHQCGIVHRDIKPKNILFGKAGPAIPKLADFGIAKSYLVQEQQVAHHAEDTVVVAGRPLLMYSASWAAPEQMTNQPVSYQADIYSLALITVFMLTGEAVFAHRNTKESYLMRRRSDELIDAALERHDLPSSVANLLKRACRTDPAERPGDVAEFGAEFADAILERETAADPSGPHLKLAATSSEPSEASPEHRPPLHHLPLTDDVQDVAGRFVAFVPIENGVADLIGRDGTTRIRITLQPLPSAGFGVHVKGLNCFVARAGGRPSPGVQLQESGDVDCLLPNNTKIGTISVSFGSPAAGHRVFDLEGHAIAVSQEECPTVAAVDFGPHAEYILVYKPSPSRPKPLPNRRRRFAMSRSRS